MDEFFKTYLPWFILKEIPGLGNIAIHQLIRRFESPENIFRASVDQLTPVKRISKTIAQHIIKHENHRPAAAAELEKVMAAKAGVVCINEPNYPVLLKQIPDPPPFLTYFGTLDNTAPCIAMVGSRNATSYGLSTAQNLSGKLCRAGFQIVSGLARGIDTKAHMGALGTGGRTIAVLGSGLNRIYPKENRSLFEKIKKTGVIFSEFKMDAAPVGPNFPVRNRIIAGLSCGTVVVEAAKKSGSLITAGLTNEYNREVFAVPGSIKSSKSQGTHALLKQGAHLVETHMDIIDELYHFIHVSDNTTTFKNPPSADPGLETSHLNDYPVLKLMDPYPIHIDKLIDKSGVSPSDITAQLLELELKGAITRHPGNYFSISEENH